MVTKIRWQEINEKSEKVIENANKLGLNAQKLPRTATELSCSKTFGSELKADIPPRVVLKHNKNSHNEQATLTTTGRMTGNNKRHRH